MAVSHSSHLDTPPARPASSVWTVHDSSWSAEAMMIKKDLPGRTLDFTFDLSATPVIGRRATTEISGEMGRENKLLSQVSTVDLSTWKKPYLSQVHGIRLTVFTGKGQFRRSQFFLLSEETRSGAIRLHPVSFGRGKSVHMNSHTCFLKQIRTLSLSNLPLIRTISLFSEKVWKIRPPVSNI